MREVVIFAKAPRLGRVETRLAASLGNERALAIYERLLARVVERLSRGDWRLRLAVTPDELAGDDSLWSAGPDRMPQGVGDLCARMLRVLQRASPGAPVVIVGADIPDLDRAHIETAFDALEGAPVVFGPVGDGGFHLVGASEQPGGDFFKDVRWSAPSTLREAAATRAPGAPPGDDRASRRSRRRASARRPWKALALAHLRARIGATPPMTVV